MSTGSASAPALFDCTGRVAVVTGAAGRLGPIWAWTLVEAGAQVVLLTQPGTADRPELAELRGHSRTRLVEADITSRDGLLHARRRMLAVVGPPDILVANAGLDHPPTAPVPLRLDDLHPGDIAAMVDTNVVGTMLTVSLLGEPMVAARRGSIVLIGSQYAVVAPKPQLYTHLERPFTKNPAYGASKAAVVNLARSFATQWGPAGVRVNALSPGGVRGDQDPEFQRKFAAEVPLGRMLEPAELRGPLLFLASDASSYLTGCHLVVDGGYSAW